MKTKETKTAKEHTPTPWRINKENPLIIEALDGRLSIAEVHSHSDTSEFHTEGEAVANAEAIVRAVNSLESNESEIRELRKQNEALLKAAKKGFDVLREAGFVSGLIESQYDVALKSLGEAIARAEGREK